jgi:hypothetical protein
LTNHNAVPSKAYYASPRNTYVKETVEGGACIIISPIYPKEQTGANFIKSSPKKDEVPLVKHGTIMNNIGIIFEVGEGGAG